MSTALPVRRGTANRWQAILVAFAIWSGLFQMGEHYSALGFAPGALGFPLLALALLFAVSFTAPDMFFQFGRSSGRQLRHCVRR
jgi:hypothetical protein